MTRTALTGLFPACYAFRLTGGFDWIIDRVMRVLLLGSFFIVETELTK